MNSTNIRKILSAAKRLDDLGRYKEADKIFLKISQYGPNGTAKNPAVQYYGYDVIEPELDENQLNYQKKPNLRKPEYYDLGGEADGPNMEGILNGPDPVPGPAFIDPGNPASSPSMAIRSGDELDDKFSFENNYEKNVENGKGYINYVPYR